MFQPEGTPSKCKGPEVGSQLECSENSQEAMVAGTEQAEEKQKLAPEGTGPNMEGLSFHGRCRRRVLRKEGVGIGLCCGDNSD